ncbi:MAG: hypothetical protein JWP15_2799 [Alphaproteobacteria bacterium]|nr:hypothetical protein [Alphaproteobacteria bacterium]
MRRLPRRLSSVECSSSSRRSPRSVRAKGVSKIFRPLFRVLHRPDRHRPNHRPVVRLPLPLVSPRIELGRLRRGGKQCLAQWLVRSVLASRLISSLKSSPPIVPLAQVRLQRPGGSQIGGRSPGLLAENPPGRFRPVGEGSIPALGGCRSLEISAEQPSHGFLPPPGRATVAHAVSTIRNCDGSNQSAARRFAAS